MDAPLKLAATVVVSTDDEWVKQWNTPAAPQITRASHIENDQKVTVAVLVSGLRAVKGQIRYRVAMQILDPKGKAIFNRPDFALISQKAPPKAGTFLLVDPTFDFSAEASDPRGFFRFRATLTDLNAAPKTPKVVTGEAKVELK